MANGKIIYTVVIDRGEESEPWVSSFDSKAKARAFVRKVNRKLKKYGIQSEVAVFTDYGPINCEQYLDWFDDIYTVQEDV